MATQLEICNRALVKLGAETMAAFGENTRQGRLMSAIFDTVFKAELRKRNWNFAIKRATLTAPSAAAWGYAWSYALPADWLRPVQIGDFYEIPGASDYLDASDAPWTIEDGFLLTDYPAPLNARYVYAVSNYAALDAAFVEALAAKLALEACEALTQSAAKREALAKDHQDAIREAARANAIERPPVGIPDTAWTLGRL